MRLSLWNSGRHAEDYRFIDKTVSEHIGIGGTAVYVHLYIGPYQQQYPMVNRDGSTIPAFDPANPPPQPVAGNITSIQDVLFLENRDRKYASTIFELRGVYNINDLDFDLRQFGMFLSNDTLFIEFHLNDMTAILGRRLYPGDVLELPHRRDDTQDLDAPSINKFYIIEDASRAAGGYSATWWPHIWRVKVSPMPAGQEYQDILNLEATNPLGLPITNASGKTTTIGSLMSDIGTNLGIDSAVVDQAKVSVSGRYFETRQYYVIVPEAESIDYPWIFAGDGIPPNGAALLGSGHRFPKDVTEGDYFLRTDFQPTTLFMYLSGGWRMQETDNRHGDWSAAHRLLELFIQDKRIETFADGHTAPVRTMLSQAVKPRADF